MHLLQTKIPPPSFLSLLISPLPTFLSLKSTPKPPSHPTGNNLHLHPPHHLLPPTNLLLHPQKSRNRSHGLALTCGLDRDLPRPAIPPSAPPRLPACSIFLRNLDGKFSLVHLF